MTVKEGNAFHTVKIYELVTVSDELDNDLVSTASSLSSQSTEQVSFILVPYFPGLFYEPQIMSLADNRFLCYQISLGILKYYGQKNGSIVTLKSNADSLAKQSGAMVLVQYYNVIYSIQICYTCEAIAISC